MKCITSLPDTPQVSSALDKETSDFGNHTFKIFYKLKNTYETKLYYTFQRIKFKQNKRAKKLNPNIKPTIFEISDLVLLGSSTNPMHHVEKRPNFLKFLKYLTRLAENWCFYVLHLRHR